MHACPICDMLFEPHEAHRCVQTPARIAPALALLAAALMARAAALRARVEAAP